MFPLQFVEEGDFVVVVEDVVVEEVSVGAFEEAAAEDSVVVEDFILTIKE